MWAKWCGEMLKGKLLGENGEGETMSVKTARGIFCTSLSPPLPFPPSFPPFPLSLHFPPISFPFPPLSLPSTFPSLPSTFPSLPIPSHFSSITHSPPSSTPRGSYWRRCRRAPKGTQGDLAIGQTLSSPHLFINITLFVPFSQFFPYNSSFFTLNLNYQLIASSGSA